MTRGRRETAEPTAYASARVRGGAHRRRDIAITDAAPSLTDDVAGRMRRYWLLMGLRVLFLLLLFVVPRQWWWLCILGALVAPLLAVMVANSGREGGSPAAARGSTDLVPYTPTPDDDATGPQVPPGPAATFHVRPGEYLR
jgi:hypothetical protein